MRSPFSPLQLVIFVAILATLLFILQLQLISIAFERLGLSSESAFLLLISCLFGSAINLPLATVQAESPPKDSLPPRLRRLLRMPDRPFEGHTVIALNVGGGLIPVIFSTYLLTTNPLPIIDAVLATAIVSAISYAVSRPIPRMGVAMPVFIAPIVAALVAVIVNQEHSPPLAYICGTLGVVIGADLLRLKDIKRMGTPMASIGGAGTFDGIFITGVVAVLLTPLR